MKKRLSVSFLAMGLSLPLFGASSATLNLYCLSLRFQPASVTHLGLTYTLELTTIADSTSGNGELAPFWDPSQPSHGCLYRLILPNYIEPIVGEFHLDVPSGGDANRNGFSDFFETSQAVNSQNTAGWFDDGFGGQGTVTATWSRAAQSKAGTCRLHLVTDLLNETFTHTFELMEYSGPLTYSMASSNIIGQIELREPSNPANTLAGPAIFSLIDSNTLVLQDGTWTHSSAQLLEHRALETGPEPIERDRKNYLGFLDFVEGDPATAVPDYLTWFLVINDPNDANQNGIPDLSDPVVVLPPPRLEVSRTNNQVRLTLIGTTGETYAVEQIPSLMQTEWSWVQSVTLTNDIQAIATLPATNSAAFWRARQL